MFCNEAQFFQVRQFGKSTSYESKGHVVTELDTKAQNLKHHSSKYKKDAALLNATSWFAIGAGGTVLFLVFFFWYKFLL